MQPKIKFQLHQELDIQIGARWPGATIQHSELASTTAKEFVEKYCRDHKDELDNATKKMAQDWELVEDDFFKAVDLVFENYSWPDGLYVCYSSIFDCNPRFLENKTFQAYYKNDVGIQTIAAHEMLHFIFYDYVEKKENEFYNFAGAEKIWRLSESFDVLALENPVFEKFKPKIIGGYTEIENLNHDLREFLREKTFTIANFMQAVKSLKI